MGGHPGITPATFWITPAALGPPQASGRRLQPSIHPSLFPDISGLRGVFLSLLAALPIVGLHPPGLQALDLPSFKTKERAWSQRQWFHGQEELTWLKQGPRATPHRVRQVAGRTREAVFAPRGRGRLAVIGGIEVRWAHWLPGKIAEGTPLTSPLISYQVETFRCTVRTIISWGLGQVFRKGSR